MGTGKTSLVKDGLAKALGIPFSFIALGGAADGSFLDGHSFTYEGSMYGKIAEVLMRAQCMNPLIFFDELDKVSDSSRGAEVTSILTHLTDSIQNERFNDKYFGEIDFDLSKSLIIFSYNDEHLVNPILRDRMITIHVKGYDVKDKLILARDYLLPEILKQYKFLPTDIVFEDEVIIKIIQKVPDEEGVRNLKRGLESIVSWINMHRYIPHVASGNSKSSTSACISSSLVFPLKVTSDHVNSFISTDSTKTGRDTYLQTMYT
jgi:ATP-dependent Lon protease